MNTKFKGSYIPVPKSNLPSIKISKNKVKKLLVNYFLCLQFVHSFKKGYLHDTYITYNRKYGNVK